MAINRIFRFHARVDGESVFLLDVPKGSLVNATILNSTLQHRAVELLKMIENENDTIIKQQLKGRLFEIEDLLRALGEEPL